MIKSGTFEEKMKIDLMQLGIEHVWVPSRPWKAVTSVDGINIFVEGKGCRVTDIDKKTYLDYASGIFLMNIGYGRKEIAEAIYKQVLELTFAPTHEFSIPKIKLAAKLAQITPGNLWRIFFSNSGAEANETAMKIARKYQMNSGFPKRWKIISRRLDYHGSTFATMATGWRPPFFLWPDYEPLIPGVRHVEYPICRNCPFALKYPDCNLQCAKAVERMIEFELPETVAAVLMEPWSWTSYLAIPPPEYWPLVKSICDKYGVLLIIDEVLTGFGRTGKWWAMEHFNVVPDIMVVSKALTGGYVPMGATIVSKKVAKKFEGGYGEALHHSCTFEGHPVACAAALANIEIFEREKLVERSATMGDYLFDQLQSFYKYPLVGEVRGGHGLYCAIELVKNRKNGEAFGPEENTKVTGILKTKLKEAGLWGMFTNPIMILPPLIITQDEIDELVTKMEKVIKEIDKGMSA